MNTGSKPARLVLTLLFAQLLAATATAFFPVHQKGVVFLALATLGSMTIVASSRHARRTKLVSTLFATCLTMLACYGWRQFYPLDIFGPFSGQLEKVVLAVTGSLIVLACAIIGWCFDSAGVFHRARWAVFVMVALGTLAFCWTACPKPPSTSDLINQIVTLERETLPDDFHRHQELGFLWAACGRMHETRRLVTQSVPSQVPRLGEDLALDPVPWRIAIDRIARNHRIVFLMESHLDTSHREWIEQTLPIFRDAGFTHYAVEALSESGTTLSRRGYPVRSSGYYTMDPRFGNALRTAIGQGLTIVQYDGVADSHDQREESAATKLAAIIAADPSAKLLVHAGFAHVCKQPIYGDQRWLASLLWEKSGIEPYSIYQTVESPAGYNVQQLAQQIGDFDEPVILSPLPELNDFQIGHLTNEVVDALLVHPRERRTAVDDRRPVFSSHLRPVRGECRVAERPIVIGAYKKGESSDAIALDQVLLRQDETSFELWVPAEEIEIRVDGREGPLEVSTTTKNGRMRIAPS